MAGPAARHITLSGLFAPLLFLLVACVPTSENPVIIQGQDPHDPALIGLWFGAFEEDDDPVLLNIFMAEDDDHDVPGGMRMIMTGYTEDADDDGGWAVLYALSAEINGEHFLSVDYQIDNGEDMEGPIRRYHIYHYEITNQNTLILRAVDEDKLEEIITAGELTGTIEKAQFSNEIRLTDTSANIAAFLGNEPLDRLFSDEPGEFTRQLPKM